MPAACRRRGPRRAGRRRRTRTTRRPLPPRRRSAPARAARRAPAPRPRTGSGSRAGSTPALSVPAALERVAQLAGQVALGAAQLRRDLDLDDDVLLAAATAPQRGQAELRERDGVPRLGAGRKVDLAL